MQAANWSMSKRCGRCSAVPAFQVTADPGLHWASCKTCLRTDVFNHDSLLRKQFFFDHVEVPDSNGYIVRLFAKTSEFARWVSIDTSVTIEVDRKW
jgi:hypothetical protein